MTTQIKFNGKKSVVVIETPVSSKRFTQVTCLMSHEEFEDAKKERPDLVFKIMSELNEEAVEAAWSAAHTVTQNPYPTPVDQDNNPVSVESEDVTKGITVKSLTLPHNLDAMINQLFEKE